MLVIKAPFTTLVTQPWSNKLYQWMASRVPIFSILFVAEEVSKNSATLGTADCARVARTGVIGTTKDTISAGMVHQFHVQTVAPQNMLLGKSMDIDSATYDEE